MRRREFLSVLGGAAAWPLALRAQEAGRIYRLGVIIPSPKTAPRIAAFFDELQVLGFVEGQNLKIDGGYSPREEQIPEVVAAMAKSPLDVVCSVGDPYTRAIQNAMPNVPVVVLSGDLMATGFVQSFSNPGGNITGLSLLNPELDSKRQEILMEAVPGARRMAMLADTAITTSAQLQALQDAVRARGIEPSAFTVRAPGDIVPALDQVMASGAAAVNFLASPLFSSNRRILIERVAALRLPAIYEWPEMAEEGGLIGYGANLSGIFRQVARQVVKVLRGVKPADIPVEQPTNFELVINLKAAHAIGHEIPAGLVLRADKLIE
jgi:putative ABC transport system substrate-binding protein